MMIVTVLLIALTAALPSVYTEGQREREEELLFRGSQYKRAIGLYRRQFNRFPTSVKDLLETNGLHFLRRPFRDPMSRSGKWRFIHANAAGVPIDSKTIGGPKRPGAEKPPGPGMESGETTSGERSGERAGAAGGTAEIKGAFILGVASSSSRESIRVVDGHTHYDEWEFLAIELNAVPPPSGAGPPNPLGKETPPGLPTKPAATTPPAQPPPPETPPEPPAEQPAPDQ